MVRLFFNRFPDKKNFFSKKTESGAIFSLTRVNIPVYIIDRSSGTSYIIRRFHLQVLSKRIEET